MTVLADGIDVLLEQPGLGDLVVQYFEPTGKCAGHTFDTVGDNPASRFTEGDLLAVSLLDVAFPPQAVRAVLGAPRTWEPLLEAVPSDKPLWRVSSAEYDAAAALWRELTGLAGVGPTRAGKLMARKRPALVPIYDDVIARFLLPTKGEFWRELRDSLRVEGRRRRIDALADELVPKPTTLRLLDVAIWMRCGNSTNARTARIAIGLPAEPLARD